MNEIIWRLKKGSEKKFRSGHPWVFSNELAQSPKGLPPGAPVALTDHQGSFLARGYGHPNSLICFRTLTTNQKLAADRGLILSRLKTAAHLRKVSGVHQFSHRLCFAEGDYLPGLVIDRYRLKPVNGEAQVFVVQSSTAGMDRLLPDVFAALEDLVQIEGETPWENSSIVLANDSKSRQMEGIPVEPKKIVRAGADFRPEEAQLLVQPGLPELPPLVFTADLIGGQKTGFFLDQRLNVQMMSRFLDGLLKQWPADKKTIRVLDLCCYIGQWGSQLAHLAKSRGLTAEVTCVDASARALELAARNVEAHGGKANPLKLDVLSSLEPLPLNGYDVVICDPPAFIKKKKDLPTGTQAYGKLNREALRRVAAGGLFVSCSCSGLLTEEDFRSMLARASSTSSVGASGALRWLGRGSHSPDHPQRPEFTQGTYLKSWFGLVTEG